MQSLMSAFKRSTDKKQKKLLQDSFLSSTDSSFTQDENARTENTFTPPAQRSRTNSFKPMQLLRTPSTPQGYTVASTPPAAATPTPAGVIMTDMVSLLVCMLHAAPSTVVHSGLLLCSACSLLSRSLQHRSQDQLCESEACLALFPNYARTVVTTGWTATLV